MTDNRKFMVHVNSIVLEHIVPDMQAPVGYLRGRAAWTLSQYAEVPLKRKEDKVAVIQALMGGLQDPEQPVRFMAATALRFFVDTPEADMAILPHLEDLVRVLLSMMTELGIDEVVSTMQKLIERYGPQLAEMAIPLATSLAQVFGEYVNADEDGEDDELGMAAMNTLESIAMLMDVVEDNPAAVKAFEEPIMPVRST